MTLKNVKSKKPLGEERAVDEQGQASLGRQVSDLLLWMNERAWPLGGGLLIVALLYLQSFIIHEQVPLSITSSVLAALPIMLGLVVLFVAILTGFFLVPTVMLFTMMKPGHSVLKRSRKADDQVDEEAVLLERSTTIEWVCIQVVSCVAFFGLVLAAHSQQWNVLGDLSPWVVLFGAWVFLVARLGRKAGLRLKEVSADYWFVASFSCLSQMLVMAFVVLALLNVLDDLVDSELGAFGFIALAILLVVVLQLAVAMLISEIKRESKFLQRATVLVAVLVSIIGLYPQGGGRLAGLALQMTSSGGRGCAVLAFAPGNDLKYRDIRDILTSDVGGPSQRLRVLAEVDGSYVVRPFSTGDKSVTFVSRVDVGGIDDCPKRR